MFVRGFDDSSRPEDLLAATVDAYATRDLKWLSDEQLMDSTEESFRRIEQLRAEALRQVGEIDRRKAYEPKGHLSMTSWLEDRCRMASGEAREHTRVAQGLRHMPGTREAFLAGDLDMTRVRDLVHARKRHPVEYERDEEVLVDNAKGLAVGDHRKTLAYWAQALDHEEALEDSNALYERRRWHQSTDFSGMEHIDAELAPDAGHLVQAAIEALADPANLDPDDDRTPAQRRVDAAVDIFRFFLDHYPDLPTSHGERPHGSVIIDYPTLLDNAGGRSETTDGRVLHPETIRRLLCDAKITRIVVGPEGSPLEVGRARRTVTPAQWKALVIRDRGCVHPGCGRPPAWCDVHHKVPWARGGATDLDNLELRCRLHHRLVHEGQTTPLRRGRQPPDTDEPPRARGP